MKDFTRIEQNFKKGEQNPLPTLTETPSQTHLTAVK